MFSIKYDTQNEPVILDINQLNTHKASFRYNDLLNQEANDKVNFEGKKALLFISVGQEYHEKGKFLATIELVNKYPFLRCDIVLADTLQRHNHFGRLGEEKAERFTKEAGDHWLKRSDFALSQFKIPHHFIRWDELLQHEDYAKLKEEVVKCYHENEEYKFALHTNVNTYMERLKLLNPVMDEDALFKNGLGYLIEECPIVMPLWAQMGYDYIIYPKPITPGMQKTRDLFVTGQYDNKCQWLYLRFKKR
jgi:tRNA-dependent cyclodipeptide synthase